MGMAYCVEKITVSHHWVNTDSEADAKRYVDTAGAHPHDAYAGGDMTIEAATSQVIGPNETLRLLSVEGNTGKVTISPCNATEWIVQDASVSYKAGGGMWGKVVGRFDNVDDATEMRDSLLIEGRLPWQLHLMEVPKGHYA